MTFLFQYMYHGAPSLQLDKIRGELFCHLLSELLCTILLDTSNLLPFLWNGFLKVVFFFLKAIGMLLFNDKVSPRLGNQNILQIYIQSHWKPSEWILMKIHKTAFPLQNGSCTLRGFLKPYHPNFSTEMVKSTYSKCKIPNLVFSTSSSR